MKRKLDNQTNVNLAMRFATALAARQWAEQTANEYALLLATICSLHKMDANKVRYDPMTQTINDGQDQ